VWAKAASRASELGVEAVALVLAAWLLTRRKGAEAPTASPPRFSWNWALRLAALLGLVLLLMDFSQAIGASPDGEWDAFSIWNVRARFLAGGPATWRYAVASESSAKLLGASHPGYPLMLSASVARLWMLAGDTSSSAPSALSLLFTLASLGLMCGMIAWMRAESAALLALLVSLATEDLSRRQARSTRIFHSASSFWQRWDCWHTRPSASGRRACWLWPVSPPDSRPGPRTRVCRFWRSPLRWWRGGRGVTLENGASRWIR